MSQFDIKKFEFEEDYVIECVCENCGETHGEEVDECESENVINETSHEAVACCNCKTPFDIWTDCYTDGNDLMCEDCYNTLNN